MTIMLGVSDKSETRTVSLPSSLWGTIESHSKDIGESRSSYIRGLALRDLKHIGKLPGSENEAVTIEALATVQLVGSERVLKTLKRLRGRAAKERGVAHAG